jgi:PAS domain S-box-containing protein
MTDLGNEHLPDLPFRQLLENLQEVVWLSDADSGRLLYATPNFEALWGIPREAAYRDRGVVIATLHPEDRPRIERAIAVEQPAGTYDTEFRFIRPDGQLRWLHSRAVPIRDDSGRVLRIVGITEDITARKRAEADLFESRERLALFGTHAPASLAMFDRDLRYLVVSERWAQSNGVSAKDLVGRLHYELFPGTPEHVREIHARALAGEPYRCDEERFVRKDGTEYWLHWEVHPWRHDPSGPVAGIIVFTEDISERKRSLALMLEIAHGVAAKTGAAFFNALADNLIRHTKAEWVTVGELVAGGRNLRDVAQRTRGLPITRLEFEIVGRPCEAVLQRRRICVCADGVAEAFPADRELAQQGMRAFAGVPLFDEDGEPIGVVSIYSRRPFSNPSEVEAVLQIFAARAQAELVRLKHEREILELNATLEQRILQRTALLEAANRDLEAFSYSVSHDLRAPLRAIDGYLSMAAEDGPLNEQQRGSLGKVLGNVKRMNELINELMGLAQVDRHEMNRSGFDLAEIARSVVATLREREPNRRVTVEFVSAPCDADPRLMRIVLENLLGNAWKFTGKRQDACILFGTEIGEDGRRIYVVHDNGAGFDPARASRLFQPFQRLHSTKEFEGTGIGLATVERIVRRHGGRIWADATPGQGATFRFTLGDADDL